MGKSTYSLEGNGTDLSKLFPSGGTNLGYSASTNTIKANYMRVVPNSHYWSDLNQLINFLDGIQHYSIQYYENMFKSNVDYFIIGLENCIKHGYKIKRFEEPHGGFSMPVFLSIDEIMDYVKNSPKISEKNFMDFKMILQNTISNGLNLTNGIKMQRTEVYKRLDGERDYQDEKWGTRRTLDGTPDEEKSVAEWINYMEHHLAEAKEKVYYLKTEEALAEIRKVTALGVRAMEIHGCPERQNKSLGTPLYEVGGEK